MTIAIRNRRQPTGQVRTVYLPEPAAAPHPTILDPHLALLTAQRQEERARRLQYQARTAIANAHNSKIKRFWLGFGAVVGFAVVAVATAITWWAYSKVGSPGLLILPAVFLAGVVTVFVFHNCTFSVHHGHR